MCKGYKTETPGQLSKADKTKRDNWETPYELRKKNFMYGVPIMGYYWEDGVKKYGERHPYYGM